MPSAAFQFDTFQSIASDVGEASWSNPGNAQESDNAYAAASLSSFSTAVVTEYLVCTGADLSSLPGNILFTKIEVNIEAQGTNTELFEIFGCESDGSGMLTLGGLNLLRAAGAGPIDLTGSDTVYGRGRNNWNFWWRERLENPDFGVAIRARLEQGQFSGSVSIDHVELVVHYEKFVKPFVRKDTRPVMEVKVAGTTGRPGDNEGGEPYQPGVSPPDGEHDWHESDESADFLDDVIAVRTAAGAQRLCLRMPAGRKEAMPPQKLASSQWEPMFDHQRDALIEVIGSWVAGDPEREVSIYLGGWLPPDPGRIDMEGFETPDVSDPEHVARLQRTFFPYRDFVGVRRFILDNSGAIDEANTLAMFKWARNNGMEFVYEAIPGVAQTGQPDPDRVGPYNAYARAAFIEDETHDIKPINFERGDCTVLMRPNDGIFHATSWAQYMRNFSRAGYALQVHDTMNVPDPPEGFFALDGDAMAVGPMYEQRRVHHVVAFPVAFPVARSARHLFSGEQRHGREGAFRALTPSVAIPITHPVAFPVTGVGG